jgi:Flp pilus assembly protein TadD
MIEQAPLMPSPRRSLVSSRARFSRLWASWLALALAAALLGGCQNFGDVTGSIGGANQQLPTDEASLRAYTDRWGKTYDKNPGEKVASINYARALRALTRYTEAAAVMQAAAVKAPKDFEVLGAYGKALADNGEYLQAKDVLTRAYPAERPDWTILSVQGTVDDRLDDHTGAQRFYREALKISPGDPTVLSNLGLSYALTKQLDLAEDALRQAAASPRADTRVRQNLALVLALDGKFAEAEEVSSKDMSAQAATANVQAIRAMIAQNDTWRTLQSGAPKKRVKIDAPDSLPQPAGQPTG